MNDEIGADSRPLSSMFFVVAVFCSLSCPIAAVANDSKNPRFSSKSPKFSVGGCRSLYMVPRPGCYGRRGRADRAPSKLVWSGRLGMRIHGSHSNLRRSKVRYRGHPRLVAFRGVCLFALALGLVQPRACDDSRVEALGQLRRSAKTVGSSQLVTSMKALAEEAEAAGDFDVASDAAAELVARLLHADRYQDALRWANRGLTWSKLTPDSTRRARALFSAAVSFTRIGAMLQANTLLQRAQETCLRGCGKWRSRVAFAQGNEASATGHWNAARLKYLEALKTDPGISFPVHLNIARTYRLEARPRDLQAGVDYHLRKAREAASRSGPLAELRYARVERARAESALSRGEPQAAARALDRIPGHLRQRFDTWHLDSLRGEIAQQSGELDTAIALYERATEAVIAEESRFGAVLLALDFFRANRAPFEKLFEAYALVKDHERALQAMIWVKEREFLGQLLLPAAQRAQRVSDWGALGKEYDELREGFTREDFESSDAFINPERLHCSADPPTVFIEYFLADGHYYRVSRGFHARRVMEEIGPSGPIEALVEQWLSSSKEDERDETGEHLAKQLLPSLEGYAHNSRLVLSTSQGLNRVPFAALKVSGRYLVERFIVSYAPRVYSGWHHRDGEPSSACPSLDAAVIADPRNNLPYARLSSKGVSKAGESTATYTGESADRNSLLASLCAERLHIAAHSGYGLLPTIQLADGDFNAQQLLQSKSLNRLVVLASCGSADSLHASIWRSWLGAFLLAGAAQVVGSLWPIRDEYTLSFFKDFYRAPVDLRVNAAQALAIAQRNAIARGDPSADWAGFVMATRLHSEWTPCRARESRPGTCRQRSPSQRTSTTFQSTCEP